MHALVGVASRGPGAAGPISAACRRLGHEAHVLARSRPWWAPARDGGHGLLVAAHVEVDLPHQGIRPWLWALEGGGRDAQFELLAGRQRGTWRWSLDLRRDRAWLGPLSDAAPDLPLADGLTAGDHLAALGPASTYPWVGVDGERARARPAPGDHVRLGRTWETLAGQPAGSRPGRFLP